MISIRTEEDHDCIWVELVDEESRVQIHMHSEPDSRGMANPVIRSMEVASTVGPIYVANNVRDKLPCDPRGFGGQHNEVDPKSDSGWSASPVDDVGRENA